MDVSSFERRKVVADHNMNVVEVNKALNHRKFCTDSCLNNKYTIFELTSEHRDCLTNCYRKVAKIGGFVRGEMMEYIEKKLD